MSPRFAFMITVALLLASACEDQGSFVSVGEGADRELPGEDPLDGSTLDGSTDGSMDGSAGRDGSGSGGSGGAGNRDGSVLDDLELPDGSVVLDDGAIQLPDGEVIDQETAEMRYTPEVDVSTCEISAQDSLTVPVDISDEGGFVIAPSFISGFGMALSASSMGNCPHNVGVGALPSLGTLLQPSELLPDCKVIRDVALLGVREGFRVAWVDNATNSAELHHVLLDRMFKPVRAFERTTVTNSLAELELKPVLADVSGRALLTWITRDAVSRQQSIMAKFLDGEDQATFAIAAPDAGHDPQGLAASRIGIENRGAVAWVGPVANPGVWLQPLDETGKPFGGAIKLTDRVGASSSVDLAPRIDGGAVVYSIVIDSIPQVRFRRLDRMGLPRDDERALVAAPQRAQDASIAPIGGSYAIAYRSLPRPGESGAEIRLVFATREGTVARDEAGRPLSYLVGESTISTGRTYVRVSVDGVLMVGWLDAAASGNVLKVARRNLSCGL